MMMLYARIFPIELAIPVGVDEFPPDRDTGRRAPTRRPSRFRLLHGVFA